MSKKKQVLVTGAAGGIGTSIVNRLAREGYEVIGTDLQKPIDRTGMRAFLETDLGSDTEVARLCGVVGKSHSPLWAIVCSAGVYPIKQFARYGADMWDQVINVNLRSVFLLAEALWPKITRGGRIVVISSGAAHIGSRDAGYSASKAGVLGLVRSLAANLGPKGVLVNAVCPGIIATPMSERMKREEKTKYLARTSLGRAGTPKEVAVCVSFLLSEENSYVTGASLDVNGGLYMR